MPVTVAIFILALHALRAEAAVSVSFSAYPAYIEQRDCIKLCLWHVSALDDLIAVIGCSPPWVNECFCNPELASSASSFLSDCVASRCTAPKTAPAVTSALSAYKDYCSANGFSIPTVASIQSYSSYVLQPSCVQQCVWSPAHSPSDGLMPAIGCGPPWENACLCNSALASSAGAFLSTCVASKCATGADAPEVAAAIGVYDAYCSAAGLPIPLAVVSPQTTVTESWPAQSTGSATTRGVVEPPPAATAAVGTDQSAGGLSAGAIAGIVIGAVAGVALLVASAAFIICRRRRRPTEMPPFPHTTAQRSAALVYEKPTDPIAVEADSGTPSRYHELSSLCRAD